MHGDFAKQLRFLKLRLEDVLLCSQAGTVAGVGGLFHLLEKPAVLFEDCECFGEMRELEIEALEFSEDGAAHGLDLLLRNIRVAFRNLALQAQLAWIRNILRNTEAKVGEVAVGIAGEGARAADADMLQIELRVGQRGNLRRYLFRGLPALPRRFNLWIVLLRFHEQIGKRSDRSRVRRYGLLRENISPRNSEKQNHTKTSNKSCARQSCTGILSRYRKHLFLLYVCNEAADYRRVSQQGHSRKTSADQRDSGDTNRDKTVRCRTVEQRIRSAEKSEECTAPEANAAEPQNPSEMLRGTLLPEVKQEYRSQPAQARGASRAERGAHSVTAPKPSPCSNRDSDSMDRRAWNHSTSYSVGLASSRTCSPQIAGPTVRPRPK